MGEQRPKDYTTSPKETTGTDLPAAAKEEKVKIQEKPRRKKEKRQVTRGRVYIQATYNNTIVTVTDQNGNVLITSSAGQYGFKGPKKSTAFAAGIIVRNTIQKIEDCGLRAVDVLVKGIGAGREAAIRSLNSSGLEIMSIKDVTPIPHNGCRPKKVRRV